jgi:hypothetical protein
MTNPGAAVVYLLCFATSVGCGLLLARSYMRNRTPLLLWSAACFILLALNNFLVVIDLIFLPGIDLAFVRSAAALAAVATLLYGFIWELE